MSKRRPESGRSRSAASSSDFLFGIFFFGYFLFEIPGNLFQHKIGARVWIARILISWGVVAALTGCICFQLGGLPLHVLLKSFGLTTTIESGNLALPTFAEGGVW